MVGKTISNYKIGIFFILHRFQDPVAGLTLISNQLTAEKTGTSAGFAGGCDPVV